MPRIAGERRGVKVNEVLGATLTKVRAEVSERLGREVEQALEAKINQMLCRAAYVRREQVASWVEIEGVCRRLQRRQSRRFSRNGRRQRRLLTPWDEVSSSLLDQASSITPKVTHSKMRKLWRWVA